MTVETLSAENLDYLQRTGFEPPEVRPGGAVTQAPIELRTMVRIDGVGRFSKAQRQGEEHSFAPHSRPTADRREPEGPAPVTADLLVGLANYHVPLAFFVGAEPGRTSLRVGTWLPSGSATESVEHNERLLETALAGLYPVMKLTPEQPVTGDWELGGLALGNPMPKHPHDADGLLPIDRLLRALGGARWGALILAQPVDETLLRQLRLRVINEMRSVQTNAKQTGVPSPLADHYVELLELQLRHLTEGQGMGSWRTAVYLLGDADSYHRLTSAWRGVFCGERSLPEPVRVWDHRDVPTLAAAWALPDPMEDAAAPGHYRQPFQHQTLLTSNQLATYVQLPNWETNGFAITQVPDFDVVPPPSDEGSVELGAVVERERVTANGYGVHPDKLTRHLFVAGATGAGKTNTIFHLLRQLARRGVPFLVVEPAKTEYRVLLRDEPLGEQLQVFTLGDETVSPFRLNPFEVPEGIPVAVHLDLLRSVFHVSFGMWTPLPQVLEASLYGIYADRGWDVTTGHNRRLDNASERSSAFPTLSDLVRKVEEVVPRLGYEERITADLRAALRTRLNSLRAGGKGRMLDGGTTSSPIASLLERPTVLELEGMGDDDDKAFMMALLMTRLAEHRRMQGDAEGLRHLLVIEEAHRLFAKPAPRADETESDARGKAVGTFTHLLSEVRAYGQGVAVAEQIPGKLVADVLKNTNLKVAHRTVARDDREALGATMAMTSPQTVALATLPVGRAAVFTDGEDAPLLLQVPLSKGGSGTWPGDDEVRRHMAEFGSAVADRLPSADCDERCLAEPAACELARELADEPAVLRVFSRLVLSAVLAQGGVERVWPDVVAVLEPRRPRWVDHEALLRCVARHSAYRLAGGRGARAGWSYAHTTAVGERIDRTLLAHLEGDPASDTLTELRALLLGLQGAAHGPFAACAAIWGERPDPCLCRHPVAELVAAGGFGELWGEARRQDQDAAEEAEESGEAASRPALWDLSQDAAYQLVEFPAEGQDPELAERLAEGARCVALCFAQQMLSAEDWAHPATQRRAMAELFLEAGHEATDEDAEEGSDGRQATRQDVGVGQEGQPP